MPVDLVVVQTDAKLADSMLPLLGDVFSDKRVVRVTSQGGPEQIPDFGHAVFFIVNTYFTITGGIPGNIEAIRGLLAFLRGAAAREGVRPTTIEYTVQESDGYRSERLELSTASEEVAKAFIDGIVTPHLGRPGLWYARGPDGPR